MNNCSSTGQETVTGAALAQVLKRAEPGRLEMGRTYNTGGKRRLEYAQLLNDSARIVEQPSKGDGLLDLEVNRDSITSHQPHIIIMLDGMPYRMVAEYYHSGGLRRFHPPSKLISPFPSMTDVAFSEYFHSLSPIGWEARYFDPNGERLAGGLIDYLSGRNAPWSRHLTYRASLLTDAISYLYPRGIFREELRRSIRIIERMLLKADKTTTPIYIYYRSSAGTAHSLGVKGFEWVLEHVDSLCEQLLLECRGRIHISLLADHGHSMQACRRVSLKKYLKERGYQPRNKVKSAKDVAVVEFGLVTYAAIGTRDPEAVAEEILKLSGTNLAIYPVGEKIIVRSAEGLAEIRHGGGRFHYHALRDDPLQLLPTIEQLNEEGQVDAEGFIDDQALLRATSHHKYPDPLYRIWRGFHGLTRTASSLVVTFRDSHCHGLALFDAIVDMSSTHGALNQTASATFIMSTTGRLPPVVRMAQARALLEKPDPKVKPKTSMR